MHPCFRALVAKHPFQVAGDGKPAHATRTIAQSQHRELDRRVDRHVHAQLGVDAVLAVFENAVAEAMTRDIRRRAAPRYAGQQCGRPEAAAFLVAQVIRLGVCIADRVIRPRRETELVRVFAPGVGAAALGNQRSKRRIRQDIHPRCGRHPSGNDGDDVLPPIRGEPAQPVRENQVALRLLDRSRGFGATAARGWQRRNRGRCGTDPFELLCQRPVGVADDDAGDRLQQDAVPIVDLAGRAQEDATGLVDAIGAAACGDKLRDLFVQGGPVTVVVLAEDHQIHYQSVHAPIRVGLYELAHQIDIRRVCHF